MGVFNISGASVAGRLHIEEENAGGADLSVVRRSGFGQTRREVLHQVRQHRLGRDPQQRKTLSEVLQVFGEQGYLYP